MKRLLVFIFLAAAALLSAEPNVRVLQAEYMRHKGEPDELKFQPDYSQFPGINFVQGTPAQANYFVGASAHATQVTRILLAGPAAGKVAALIVAEAVTYQGNSRENIVGLNGSTYLESVRASWDVENHSWGGSDPFHEDPQTIDAVTYPNGVRTSKPILVPGILAKFAERLERDNVLAFVALPNPGVEPKWNRLLSAATSRNLVKVASSRTGYVGGPGMVPDVFEPVDWNSFSSPTAAEVGIAMVSWCKDHHVDYKAYDLRNILIGAAVRDSAGRPIVNSEGTMAALARFYHFTDPVPPPPAPVVTAPPPPVSATPSPTTPAPTPVNSAGVPKPVITQFTHNAAWASVTTPARIYWDVQGADTITLSDPAGQTINVAPHGSVTSTKGSSSYVWTLRATNAGGMTSKTDQVHGILTLP